jgi:hypothetical protein
MRLLLRGLTTVLLLLCLSPRPAEAAPSAEIEAYLGKITLAPSGAEKTTLLWVRLADATPDTEHHFELTVDVGAAAAFADVDLVMDFVDVTTTTQAADETQTSAAPDRGSCSRTASVFTCAWDAALHSDGPPTSVGLASARPTENAKTGDSAPIVIKARVDGGSWTTRESVIRVGEGVDLAAGEEEEITAAPGRAASATPVIRNVGEKPINGAWMYLASDARLLTPSSYSNCRYDDGSVLCEFDTVLQPGRSYGLSEPVTLRPPANSVPGSRAEAVIEWIITTEAEDWSEFLPPPGTYGTSAPLTLQEMQGALSVPEADVRPQNDSSAINLTVAGTTRPDLAAIGARRTVAVGDKVTIDVGVRSLGPGTLQPDLYDNNVVATRVVLPGNVAVSSTDPRCEPSGGEVANEFWCESRDNMVRGQSAAFNFVLDVEQPRGEAGSVTVADGFADGAYTNATGRTNDVAEIVLAVPGADGPDRPGLPITGPGVRWPLIGGLTLVLAGLLLAARRVRPPGVRGAHRLGK